MFNGYFKTVIGIFTMITICVFTSFAQNGNSVEINWNSTVLAILITAIMVGGIILYEWVRLKKM